jgi:hypothetical protein
MTGDRAARLPVLGFEDRYEVDANGNVWSIRSGRLLAPWILGGYLRVRLYGGPERIETRRVHVIVLEAFVGPRPEGMQCCHGDGDRTNNILSNLRWGTAQENAFDAVAHGSNRNANKTHCKRDHEFTPENTIQTTNPNGRHGRRCRTCTIAISAAYNRRRRAAA